MLEKLKSSATKLKQQLVALYLASRDRRTPWPGKILALCIVAYALSPIDLIPDVIPILGYLDDLVMVPLGIYIAIKLIPADVWQDCRAKAAASAISLPHNRTAALAFGLVLSSAAAVIIVILWLLAIIATGYFVAAGIAEK